VCIVDSKRRIKMKVSKILLSSFILGAFLASDAGNLSASVASPDGKLSTPVNKDRPEIPRDLHEEILSAIKRGQNTGIMAPEMAERIRLLNACKQLEQARGLARIAKAREQLKQILAMPPLPQRGINY